MPEPYTDEYYYIDPKIISTQGFGGKEFLKEQIDAYIATINCMKELVNSCVDNYEIENLKHCLSKLRSSITELNIHTLNQVINKLVSGAENAESKEVLSENLRDFLLICELVVLDLATFKQNEGISE